MMFKHKYLFLVSVLAMNCYVPVSQADEYVDNVSHKFYRGFGNLFTGIGEVPKNIVNATNKTNPVIGFTGGLVMGTVDTLARTATGIFDIVTSPIPTKSLVQPEYVWSNFNENTTYGYDHE